MTRRVVTSKRADQDIEEAVDYSVGAGAAHAAHDFVDALENTMALLSAHPSLGSSRYAIETGIPDLRGFALQRFPYVVLYSDDADAVRVHRVLHTTRDIPSELAN